MMQVLNTLLLCTFFTSTFAGDKLKNIDYVVMGYDILQGDPYPLEDWAGGVDPGLRQKIFKISYDDNNFSGDGHYQEPDNLEISDCSSNCDMSDGVKEIKTSSEYNTMCSESVKHDFGISIPDGQGGKAFQASFSATNSHKRITKKTANDESKFTFATASCCSYIATQVQELDGLLADLDDAFITTIDSLPDKYDEDKYGKTIKLFGTHYITRVQMGSRYQMMKEFSSEAWSKFEKNEEDINRVGSFSLFSFTASKTREEHEEDDSTITYNSMATSVKTFSIGQKPPGNDVSAVEWAQATAMSPQPTHMHLETISLLLGPHYAHQYETSSDILAIKKKNLEKYLVNYCRLLSEEIGMDVPCDGPPAVTLELYKGWDRGYELIKDLAECKSEDKFLANGVSVYECAEIVRNYGRGYRYFTYGGSSRQCWLEFTRSATCSEGWKTWTSYKFYGLTSGANDWAGEICAKENEECWCSGEVRMGDVTKSLDDENSFSNWHGSRVSTLCASKSFAGEVFPNAHCWCRTPPPQEGAYWDIGKKCADEGGYCYCRNGWVRFGARDYITDPKEVNRGITCSTPAFQDVAPGVNKACFCEPQNVGMDTAPTTTRAPEYQQSPGGYCKEGFDYITDLEECKNVALSWGTTVGNERRPRDTPSIIRGCYRFGRRLWFNHDTTRERKVSNRKSICKKAASQDQDEESGLAIESESLVAEVNETDFARLVMYGLAIFGCFIVVQKSVSFFQKENKYNNIDEEC